MSDNKNSKFCHLDYSRIKLESIPKEVIDKKDSLIELDISGNNFKDFYSVLNDLKQLKKLKRLKINIFTQKQAKDIIDSMPNLEYLNGEPINDDIEDSNNENNINAKRGINQSNFPSIKFKDNNFKLVFERFEEFFKLNNKMKEKFQRIIELFNNKCDQLGIKMKKEIEKMNSEEIKKELELYKIISNELKLIKENINLNIYEPDSVNILLNIMIENEKIKDKCCKILKTKKKKEKTSNENKNFNFITQKSNHSSNQIELEKGKKERKSISKKNKKNFDKWTNRSFNRKNVEKILFENNFFGNLNNPKAFSERNTKSESKYNKKTNKFSKEIELIEFYDANIANLMRKSKNEFDTLNIFDDEYNDIIIKENMNTRIINLNNLLEIINQIYKIRNNRIEKQRQNIYSKATLEQDFYNYLKSKYGLKKLIIEWYISFLSSIQAYYTINGEVFLFSLILKNELDEDSIHILNKIKNTVNSILNMVYDYNITKIRNIKQNKEFISEKEWKTITDCLYSDDNILKEKFKEEISEYINKLIKGKDLVEKGGKKILFEDLMNLLIIFNLKLRRKYLHNLFLLFSKEDTKRIGIIEIENLKNIIKNTDIFKDEEKIEEVTNELIEIADRDGSGQITFSETVQCLDNLDLITEEGKIKFLDKLSNMNF